MVIPTVHFHIELRRVRGRNCEREAELRVARNRDARGPGAGGSAAADEDEEGPRIDGEGVRSVVRVLLGRELRRRIHQRDGAATRSEGTGRPGNPTGEVGDGARLELTRGVPRR